MQTVKTQMRRAVSWGSALFAILFLSPSYNNGRSSTKFRDRKIHLRNSGLKETTPAICTDAHADKSILWTHFKSLLEVLVSKYATGILLVSIWDRYRPDRKPVGPITADIDFKGITHKIFTNRTFWCKFYQIPSRNEKVIGVFGFCNCCYGCRHFEYLMRDWKILKWQ